MRQIAVLTLFINYSVSVTHLLPILIWHSAGETCCENEINSYAKFLKSLLGESVYIRSVRIGNSIDEDKVLSLFTHPFEQIQQVCEDIKNDARFKNGYNAIGLSQGGLFIRALVQQCDGPPARHLISLGGPQQGVFAYPQCARRFGAMCSTMQFTIEQLVYSA
jgi:palmitoyl-protein thioesterase